MVVIGTVVICIYGQEVRPVGGRNPGRPGKGYSFLTSHSDNIIDDTSCNSKVLFAIFEL